MKIFATKRGWMLRLLRDERIPGTLLEFARENELRGGVVSGIGAVDEVELGAFESSRREYVRRRLDGVHELLSLQGNLCLLDGEPFLHAHVSLARVPDFVFAGGHLFGARVAVTAELFLEHTDLDLQRRLDPEIGLGLLERPE